MNQGRVSNRGRVGAENPDAPKQQHKLFVFDFSLAVLGDKRQLLRLFFED
ncbi:hypothetical protein V6G44_001949 [Burkholderia multivorans]|nr:hypothetical protein [Burkholderia multivorans]MCA8505036.1 hypothetical protein [Burkholderia multivorans]MDN7400825.1 hypothetical protein [Burkholderia multivorans]MDN7403169.1 hypothetical protein [Burkholderia multivorans]MDN7418667.1 hypothetical protein [Burkholderia multivorans]MDN7477934.1 hypothetical protein [Burkholderia multivorans]